LNQNSIILADELENAKNRVVALDSELSTVRKHLADEKEAAAVLRTATSQSHATTAKLKKEREEANTKVKELVAEVSKAKEEILLLKKNLTETSQALQIAETRVETIPQVRAEAALLVEKYEDLAFKEREQKEDLLRKVCLSL
jgi:chromosome segregation ATPase